MDKKIYLNKAQLNAEIGRCLSCPAKPCEKACPVKCCPQEFIALAKNGKGKEAAEAIFRKNPLGLACGLVCPDKFCMQACTRSRIDYAINIPKVQATIMENYYVNKSEKIAPNGKKVAIIGAGPAGLAAAKMLGDNGYQVEIFEENEKAGGAVCLIPEERLPQKVLQKNIDFILQNKLITMHYGYRIDNPSELFAQGFSGVIMSVGASCYTKLQISGEEYCLPYQQYLRHPESYVTNGKVAVIGGGNVAADCAFTAKRQGAAEVEMFVRRRLSDMRISKEEHLQLLQREINVNTLTSPEEVIQDNGKLSLIVRRNQFVDGKLQPVDNSSVKIEEFSLVITAIGSKAEEKIADARLIYAGDCLNGSTTAVEAVASGLQAARQLIDKAEH